MRSSGGGNSGSMTRVRPWPVLCKATRVRYVPCIRFPASSIGDRLFQDRPRPDRICSSAASGGVGLAGREHCPGRRSCGISAVADERY